MRKAKIFTVAIIAVIVSFFAQSTVAYYSAYGMAENVITSGNISFKIHEKTDKGTDFPRDGITVHPGDVVSKIVSIENVCKHPFYVRVKLVYCSESNLVSAEGCFKPNVDTENWIYHDGWYYYKGVVEPGATTPNVFTKVEMVSSVLSDAHRGKTLTLTVVAHAVQSENNPVSGTSTYTASGWPEE